MFENPLALVRALKGAPLSCLFAMMIANQPVTEQWLCSITGYTDKSISSALTSLKEFHLAAQPAGDRHPWILTQDAQQLPISLPQIGPSSDNSEKFRIAPSSSSGGDINPINQVEDNTLLEPDDPEFLRIVETCKRLGIMGKKRLELAQAGYDPEYIQYHVYHSESLGQAIWRIQNDWPAKGFENYDFDTINQERQRNGLKTRY